MPQPLSIPIEAIVDLLRLERDPRHRQDVSSFNVRCPFCGDEKYHLNINTQKGTYHCLLCGDADKGTGALDLYARVRFGVRCTSGVNGNSKKLFASLREELHLNNHASVSYVRKPIQVEEVTRADDTSLDKAYSALLQLPELKISDEHRDNLIKRGLSESQIQAGGYASCPSPAKSWCSQYPALSYAMESSVTFQTNDKCARMSPEQFRAGTVIAWELIRSGVKLNGIPGFFEINGVWCFNYRKGMLIPTRNVYGQIVGAQIRRDKVRSGEPRYLTVSSKGMPQGVTSGISRVHLSLFSAPLSTASKVILTEGPLKADVAAVKYPGSAVLAVQGVNNISDLPAVLSYIKNQGVEYLSIAFDMDRLLNTHVERAEQQIRLMAKDAGLKTSSMFWDENAAYSIACKLADIGGISRESIQQMTPYEAVRYVRNALEKSGIAYKDIRWPTKSKGIDDFLSGK